MNNINFYEDRLKKVKIMHKVKPSNGTVVNERCEEYIKYAEDQLENARAN
jgi:hypothetical protein